MMVNIRTCLIALFIAIAQQQSIIVDSFSIPDAVHLAEHVKHVAHVTQPIHHHHNTAIDLLNAYKHQLALHPLTTKMFTGATLAVTGDAIAQSKDVNKPYDVPRASSFGVFDMAYRALQHFSFPIIVNHCHGQYLGGLATTLLGTATLNEQLHAAAAMEQTLASQLIIVPLLYYPAFFALTGTMQGLNIGDSVQRAKDNFLPLMQRNLMFWIPVQFVQFGFIPTDLQIPFLSCAGLLWTLILSLYAGSAKKYAEESNAAKDPAEQMMAVVNTETNVQVTDIPKTTSTRRKNFAEA